MASSQAKEASSVFYETDDFTFEERSSMYDLHLERLREDRKVCTGTRGRGYFEGHGPHLQKEPAEI